MEDECKNQAIDVMLGIYPPPFCNQIWLCDVHSGKEDDDNQQKNHRTMENIYRANPHHKANIIWIINWISLHTIHTVAAARIASTVLYTQIVYNYTAIWMCILMCKHVRIVYKPHVRSFVCSYKECSFARSNFMNSTCVSLCACACLSVCMRTKNILMFEHVNYVND